MATPVWTEAEIEATATLLLQQAYPGKSVAPASFLRQQARSLAALLSQIQLAIRNADRDGVPASEVVDGVLQTACSAARLDEWAVVYGLPSSRGGFGRNGAQTSRNGAGAVTGTAGTVVPTGATLVDGTGQVQVSLVAGVTVPVGQTIGGVFQASSPGAAGNLPAGTVLRWTSPPAGLAATVTLTTGLSGGYDVESDLDLLARLLRWLRSPPHAGTAADIRRWAEEAVDLATGAALGVARGYVYRWRNGLGSSDVTITQAGSGATRDPGPVVAAAVQAYIDSLRIPSDAIRVVRPYFDALSSVSVVVRCVTSPRAAFDWADGGGVTIVSATTTTLVIATASIPASLAAAIAAGSRPRVQVPLPTVGPLPYQRRVTATAVNAPNTTLTLDSALPAAPGNGSTVWAGGGAVDAVALAILGHVDSLGPSTQSGLQDQVTDTWTDVVSVSGLAAAALAAADASGAKVLVYSPGVGAGVGIQIKVGAGSYGADDFFTSDNTLSHGPQLPELEQILVIQS